MYTPGPYEHLFLEAVLGLCPQQRRGFDEKLMFVQGVAIVPVAVYYDKPCRKYQAGSRPLETRLTTANEFSKEGAAM